MDLLLRVAHLDHLVSTPVSKDRTSALATVDCSLLLCLRHSLHLLNQPGHSKDAASRGKSSIN